MSQLVNLGLRMAYEPSSNIRAEGITIHYAGDSPWGTGADRSSALSFRDTTDHNRCATIWKAFHSYHLSQGWAGIAYNSGVCPHGVRFEGRGPGKRSGANGSATGNYRSYAICYIGGGDDPLTDEAKWAYIHEAVRFHVPLRWKHKDWFNTSCAGPSCDAWQMAGFPAPQSVDLVTPKNKKGRDMFILKNQDGREEHFDIDGDGIVRASWQSRPGGPLGPWHIIVPGEQKIAGSLHAKENPDGRLSVVISDAHFGIRYGSFQSTPGGGWLPWFDLNAFLKMVESG